MVVAYGSISHVSQRSTQGCLNAISRCCEVQGSSARKWAIARCEKVTGVTTMRMKRMDMGRFFCARDSIAEAETAPE